MKIGIITKTNVKGQLVIPKEYRKELNIDSDTNLNVVLKKGHIELHPIKGLLYFPEKTNHLKILEKTKGMWGAESKGESSMKSSKRAKELKSSKLRKEKW